MGAEMDEVLRLSGSPLSDEAAAAVDYIFDTTKDPNEVLINCEGLVASHQVENLTRKMLSCLMPGEWFNDHVLNLYFSILQANYSNVRCCSSRLWSKLYNCNGEDELARCERQGLFDVCPKSKKSDALAMDLDVILVPVHEDDSHWALAIVDTRSKKVSFWDSNERPEMQKIKTYRRAMNMYIMYEMKKWEEKYKRKCVDEFKFFWKGKVPKQDNYWDCGVYVCHFAHHGIKDTMPDQGVLAALAPNMRRELCHLLYLYTKSLFSPPPPVANPSPVSPVVCSEPVSTDPVTSDDESYSPSSAASASLPQASESSEATVSAEAPSRSLVLVSEPGRRRTLPRCPKRVRAPDKDSNKEEANLEETLFPSKKKRFKEWFTI
eukprot:Platyproteum_vivax@DN6350_c0_g1_i1.p1